MQDHSVTWRPHGFRIQFRPDRSRTVSIGLLASMYALCLPAVVGALIVPALAPALAAFLLPLPVALGVGAWQPRRPVVVDVDHQRLMLTSALGIRRTIEVRTIRSIEVRVGALAVRRWGGGTTQVRIPATLPRLVWLAARLEALRDEVSAFESDVDGKRGDNARVIAVATAARAWRVD